ncbi:Neoverrucotoxin subunit beta [Anabarilius grahami]|uniref:Neoverrucotoxin subunit beta n=1 Tax=Anabarilius grahami TaxID=495550 RepID=A0A3N0YY50_ANAGA|nr:Neoverrucotoxin subunit beta [Anabarilius grahami]
MDLFLLVINMDSVGVNAIETAALGRPFQLGMLYDCRKDALIPGIRLWNKEQLQQNICSCAQINTGFKVTASDSIQDKSKLLNIDGGLKLSLLGDLVHVSGAAKFLNDIKKSFKQQRLTLHYHSTSRFEELTVNHLPSGNIPDDDNDIATHVVTAILYGADACFVFDREVSSNEDKKTVNGEVKVALEKLQDIVSVGANADLNVNHSQQTAVKKFTCTFYGDFQLQSNPTSFEDALKEERRPTKTQPEMWRRRPTFLNVKEACHTQQSKKAVLTFKPRPDHQKSSKLLDHAHHWPSLRYDVGAPGGEEGYAGQQKKRRGWWWWWCKPSKREETLTAVHHACVA